MEIVSLDETSLLRGQDCITVAKGAGLALPNVVISCDRFQVVAMAIDAMDLVRRAEMRDKPSAVDVALGDTDRKTLKCLRRGRVVVAPRLLQWGNGQLPTAAHSRHRFGHRHRRLRVGWFTRLSQLRIGLPNTSSRAT